MLAADGKYEFEGEVLARSQKAILFRGDYWDKTEHECGIWLAKSVCDIEYEVALPGDPVRATVLIPKWLAKKSNLEDYE